MIIDSLALTNFMVYQSRQEMLFKGMSTIGIVGANEAGKSSLLQAITYALFGQSRTDRELKLINDNSPAGMLVQVGVVLPGGEKIEVERGRTRKNEAILNVSGFRGKVSDAKTYLSRKLQLDYSDFIDLSYFVQGDIHGFMTGNKREYFQRWTKGLGYWARLEKEAKQWAKDLETDLNTATRQHGEAQALLEDEDEVERTIQAAKQARYKAQQEIDVAQERIETLTGKLEVHKTASDVEDAIDSLVMESRRTETTIHSLRARQQQVGQEFALIGHGLCPVMADVKCKRLLEQGNTRRKELNTELQGLNTRLEEHESAAKATGKKIAKLKQRLPKKKDDSEVRSALAEARTDLANANRAIAVALRNLGAAKAKQERIKEAKKTLRTTARTQKQIDQKLRRVWMLRYMTGKTGVPMRIIETELALIEDKCNWVFERLGYDKRIRFAAFKELVDFETVCPACGGETWRNKVCHDCGAARPHRRKEEPTVTILDGTNERAFELESGGAQVLESFAARLAGGLFRASMSGVPMDLVMLDEVFAHLDASNRKALMELVIDRLSTEFGLKQQFVVSHHDDVINAVDDLLVVTRDQGKPTVEWA